MREAVRKTTRPVGLGSHLPPASRASQGVGVWVCGQRFQAVLARLPSDAVDRMNKLKCTQVLVNAVA
ncbi:hypothetical protein O3P69_020757 [Scylla paramamosain]|uniref:Uncharacterized protein n=1 Tax=Scylla paramamosain TaxID=85552 RepID=A0AAW0TNH8_SCYPA